MEPKLILHGGAWNIPDEYWPAHQKGLQEAMNAIYPKLQQGLTALDAVEQSVKILEADPTYDAGRGAFLNADGKIELDAIIVDGKNINFGAVAGVSNLLHPVTLARQVMEQTEHCFLIGQGAQQFAIDQGHPILNPTELLTERELAYFHQIQQDPNFRTHQPFDADLPSDTVGAVALDTYGNFAAATSTGGTPRKMPGRVGDSPLLGAGAYADNDLGACSSTGWGESIMRCLLAKRVLDETKHNEPEEAVQTSLAYLQSKFNGLAGVIGITKQGEFFFGYNTPRMAYLKS